MCRPEILFGIEEPLEESVHNRDIVLKGWCFRRDGGPIEGIRAQIGKKVFKGRRKQRRVEVAHRHPEFPAADRSGFTIELTLPRGRSTVVLSYRNETKEWVEFGRVALRAPWVTLPWVEQPSDTYADWIRRNDTLTDEDTTLIRQHIESFARTPLISVVAADDADLSGQLYPHWQIVPTIADANGELVICLESGDTLSPLALYLLVNEFLVHPDAKVFYSDFDRIDQEGTRHDPYFKPDWNPDLLRSQNYLRHFIACSRALWEECGQPAEPWDLALRTTERISADRIRHIPWILYHRRADAPEESAQTGRIAVQSHLNRTHCEAIAEAVNGGCVRVRYPLPNPPPNVSLIIPTRNRRDLLEECVASLLKHTDYPRFELIIVDNDSDDPESIAYLAELNERPNVQVIHYEGRFNYSAINNYAVSQCTGEVLGLVNNDIEATDPYWLREMVSHAVRPGIGAVGAKLFYPDGTIQHAGVYVGCRGTAAHLFCGAPADYRGPGNRAMLLQNMTAVTAACMIVRRDRYLEVGGLDEVDFEVSFNDVDFCLKLQAAGYRNVFTPYAALIHHESASRGRHKSGPRKKQGDSEGDKLYYKWRHFSLFDPAYNPNLTLEDQDYSPALRSRVVRPWRHED